MSRKRSLSSSSARASPSTSAALPASSTATELTVPSSSSGDRSGEPATSSQIFRSRPIKDRASTFIALYSPTGASSATNNTTAATSFSSLQSHLSLKTATHRIAAWRKASTQRSIVAASTPASRERLYEVRHDDDGERYGGKRLEKVLVDMDVQGVVVVGRWYGGVLLGPVRFNHIEDCAREAIGKWRNACQRQEEGKGRGDQEQSAQGSTAKRRRTEDKDGEEGEEEIKMALAAALKERDQSIAALRALLTEKTEQASLSAGRRTAGGTSSSSPPPSTGTEVDDATTVQKSTPTTPTTKAAGVLLDYSTMPLPALKRLEKARDATISWILKEIDKVEAQQAQQA